MRRFRVVFYVNTRDEGPDWIISLMNHFLGGVFKWMGDIAVTEEKIG